MATSTKRLLSIRKRNNYSRKKIFGMFLFKSCTAWRVYILLIFYIETSRYSFSNQECQCFSVKRRFCQIRRSQCLKGCKKWTPLYSNWNSILCQPWSLEGCSIWYEVWYLVTRVCHIWNDYSYASFSSRGYVRAFSSSNCWYLRTDWQSIF